MSLPCTRRLVCDIKTVFFATMNCALGGPQEVITDDREIVSAIRARLAERVGKDRYEVWFGPTTQLTVRGENLVVSVPSRFFQDWLRTHFRRDIEASTLEASGKPLALEFRIVEMVAATSLRQQQAAVAAQSCESFDDADGATTSSETSRDVEFAPTVESTQDARPAQLDVLVNSAADTTLIDASRSMDQVASAGNGEVVADLPGAGAPSGGNGVAVSDIAIGGVPTGGNGAAHDYLPRRPAPSVQRTFFALEAEGDDQPNNRQKVKSSNSRRAVPSPTLPMRRPAMLESFVVGPSNCLAHKAAQLTTEQPGTYSPLFVYGTTGTGKSHLLEGICTAFRRAHPRNVAVYLSAEQFTYDFLEALRGGGMPSFRRKYRGLALLAIDDLQFFKNKQATLTELLHTIDWLLRGGRQVVFAADRPIAELKTLGPEMAARLSGGMTCRLDPPEFATRLGIVRQQAVTLGVRAPDDVLTYIASHFTTQSRELSGALKRLHASSLAHRRPITLTVAQEALADLIDHQGGVVKLSDIERVVCEVFGLDPESMRSAGKGRAISHPRMLAMWLARKHTRAALNEIGSYFGRRSHSTVISAQKKVENWMATGTTLRLADGAVSLDEMIRRLEENLRVG